MNKLIQKTTRAARPVVLVLTLISMAVGQAGVCGLLSSDGFVNSGVTVYQPHATMTGLPDQSVHSMTPSGSFPIDGSSAEYILPLIHKDRTDSRATSSIKGSVARVISFTSCCSCRLERTSASQVSSRLGRQYTLVGAKPSGTS